MRSIFRYLFTMVIAFVLAFTDSHTVVAKDLKAAENIQSGRGVVDEIMAVIGLKPNFELRASDQVPNAAAVVYNGQRYVLYNARFMNAVNSASKTDWAAVSILAHEIGHHLNGHTLSSYGSNHADELEADEFSGFVLRKLGASLPQAQAAMQAISDEWDTSTHPGRSKRLNSIALGWNNANDQALVASSGQNTKSTQRQQRVEQPQQVYRTESQIMQPVLASKYILRDVHILNSPDEQFYVTTRLNLVQVKGSNLEVIGKVKATGDEDYPYVIVDQYNNEHLYISNNGYLLNKNGKKIGYIREHTKV